MSIEAELKKNGIEVVEALEPYIIDLIAQKVANRLYKTFPNYGFSEEEIYSKLSKLSMYKAKMPEGMSEANYFYKNTSIYFNYSIPYEDLEEFAIHECIHYLQEVKDKKNNLVKMGLSDYSDSDVYGLGLNEAAVQLMASKTIGIKKDFVKYFDISFESTSPSYYPLECCLVNQLAYLLGEDVLFESTINSNNNFKDKFVSEMSIKTYICVRSALDSILEAEENIIKLNNKILEFDNRNKKCENMSEKINEIKSEILLIFLRTQNQIISSYFNSSFKKIKTLEDVENYRRKLYNFKDYLGSTDGYTFFHEYYVEQMAALEHKYNVIENGGIETALQVSNKKQNWFTLIINKIKSLFEKKEPVKANK